MKKTFEPQTIEVTRKLDLSGLSEESADRLRKKAYDPESSDSILQRVVGPNVEMARLRIIIFWARWLQFVQSLGFEKTSPPSQTEEVTTHYRVEEA